MSSPLAPSDPPSISRPSPAFYESNTPLSVLESPGRIRVRDHSASDTLAPPSNELRSVTPRQALQAIEAARHHDVAGTEAPAEEPVIADARLLAAIRSATSAEKELAIRVAQAAERLREWCNEVQKWGWGGSFEIKSMADDESTAPEEEANGTESFEETLSGTGVFNPVRADRQQTRLDTIQTSLSSLELDDLKDSILNYYANRSRPTSSYSAGSRTESQLSSRLEFMDDMPLLTTHLLMQCLPDLYTLRATLDIWAVRLYVLKGIPRFIEDLDHAMQAMELGWEAIEPISASGLTPKAVAQHAEALTVIKSVLEQKITSLGRKLDGMLDALEGKADSLPEKWIDDFENLEGEYGRWVVESRNVVLDLQMRLERQKAEHAAKAVSLNEPSPAVDALPLEKPPQQTLNEPVEASAPETPIPIREVVETAISLDDSPASPRDIPASMFRTPAFDGATDARGSTTPGYAEYNKPSFPSPKPTPSPRRGDYSKPVFVEPTTTEDASDDDQNGVLRNPRFLIKRASVASIESFARAQVKRIEIRRNSSGSILSSPQHASSQAGSSAPSSPRASPALGQPGGGYAREESPASPYPTPSPPPQSPHRVLELIEGYRNRAESVASATSFAPSTLEEEIVESIEASPPRQLPGQRAGPPTLAIERAGSDVDATESLPESAIAPVNPEDTVSPRTSPTDSVFSHEDLNAQISDILNSVPGNIKLQRVLTPRRPSAAPTPSKSSKSASKISTISVAKRPDRTRLSNNMRSASMPLKPPFSSSLLRSGRSSPLIPDSGRSSPAPEAELPNHRVASSSTDSHRRSSHRSASATVSTLVQVPHPSGSSDSGIRLYHLHRPGSSAPPLKLHIRRIGDRVMVRVGGGWADLGAYLRHYIEHHSHRARVDTANGATGGVGFEVLATTPRSRESSLTASTPYAKDRSPTPFGTPDHELGDDHRSRETTPSLAPHSTTSRRSFSTPYTPVQEVGLAGPTVKKLELSGEKKEWVEGMVERAKLASLGGEFGSLGDVGGVRRVYRKGFD